MASSLLLEIQALEQKLAELKVQQEQASATTSTSPTSNVGREKTRLTKGNDVNLMLGGSKIGGEFTGDKTFLDTRLKKYEALLAKEEARLASKTRQPMKVTMPNGSVIEGTTWETTPMEIIKGISNSVAKTAIIAKVEYTGDRVDTDNLTVAGHGDFGEAAEDGTSKKSKAELWDLNRPLEGDCKLEILDFSDDEAKMVLWHSSAHILGQAMEQEFGAKLTIGPPIEGGYYYDSYVGDQVCTEKEWYPKLEKKTKQISKEKQEFQRLLVSKEDLLDLFQDNPFKLAIINTKIPDGSCSTVYRNGNFIDLCMGPHAPSTSLSKASTIAKHSATYWCGKETGDTLQRVYGVAFADCRECKANVALKKWAKEMEMKKLGDHRRVGPAQGLFFMHDLTPGSAFFLPHGARIYNKLVDFIKKEYWKRGYDEVVSPNIYSTDLWKISGHYQKYQDDMFLFNTKDNVEFAMKPMNCPGHCIMFRHLQGRMSHNKLPLRMADFGVLHRNERSGALGGLTRVRRFQQDDAHIFCRPDQVRQEVIGALEFMAAIYKIFGMSFSLMRSTRPESAIGADTPEGKKLWDDAEQNLTEALNEFAGEDNWKDDAGGGAFYGPKIDIKVKDCMGRSHQCATVQLDFQLPIRFDLKYSRVVEGSGGETKVNAKNEKKGKKGEADKKGDTDNNDTEVKTKSGKIYKNLPNTIAEVPANYERPVMVHRAMLGSVERMFAILVEHYGGNWPLWLSPRQVMIVPVHRDFEDYCKKVQYKLRSNGIFVDVDLSRRTMKKSIREAQVQGKYNYIVVIGEKEQNEDTVSVRARGAEDETRGVKTDDFLKDILKRIEDKTPDPPPAEKEKKSVNGGKGGNNKNNGKDNKGSKSSKSSNNDGPGNSWTKTDIRVGTIVKAWEHPDSDKLWCEEIDIGEDQPRQIASGLRVFYPSVDMMQGRKCLVVANLKPAKLGGFKSCGMVLCAGNEDHTKVEFVDVPVDAKNGERVFIDGEVGEPMGPGGMKKKKIFEALAKELKTNGMFHYLKLFYVNKSAYFLFE
jgi:threonyl-tRNA synthetase